MNLNYLAFVLPVFFIFCGLEYYLSIKKEKKVFTFRETISNLNVGLFERTCDLFITAVFHFFFVWLYDNFAIFPIKPTIFTWILLFLATDLLWYAYHRLGHRVNILWSAHVVHHQSGDFNLTVSARITMFQAAFRALFWSFIPVLGFPPEMITLILLLHGAYPFFTHTQLVGKLGYIEWILVTPSHHRVHHASNEKYLDKNFGDVLIIWDKLFGTYVEEDEKEKTVYGITNPVNSYSFLWQHFHYLMEIAVSFNRTKSLKAKWNAVFGPPESLNPGYRQELETVFLSERSNQKLSGVMMKAVLANTIFTSLFVFFYLLLGNYQNVYEIVAGSLFALLCVIHTGAMLEQRKWLFHIEFIRLTVLSTYVALLAPMHWFVIPAIALLFALTVFYRTVNKHYLQFLNINPPV